MSTPSFLLDGLPVPFTEGQTIINAAMAAGIFIPHLCHHPEFKPQGSCKLCTVKASGRYVSACTMPARDGMEVENNSPDLNDKRRTMLQMLFVEGNHFCPSCEKSGNCMLQALAYELEMLSPHFNQFYPDRPVDASHPEVLLDFIATNGITPQSREQATAIGVGGCDLAFESPSLDVFLVGVAAADAASGMPVDQYPALLGAIGPMMCFDNLTRIGLVPAG